MKYRGFTGTSARTYVSLLLLAISVAGGSIFYRRVCETVRRVNSATRNA